MLKFCLLCRYRIELQHLSLRVDHHSLEELTRILLTLNVDECFWTVRDFERLRIQDQGTCTTYSPTWITTYVESHRHIHTHSCIQVFANVHAYTYAHAPKKEQYGHLLFSYQLNQVKGWSNSNILRVRVWSMCTEVNSLTFSAVTRYNTHRYD